MIILDVGDKEVKEALFVCPWDLPLVQNKESINCNKRVIKDTCLGILKEGEIIPWLRN